MLIQRKSYVECSLYYYECRSGDKFGHIIPGQSAPLTIDEACHQSPHPGEFPPFLGVRRFWWFPRRIGHSTRSSLSLSHHFDVGQIGAMMMAVILSLSTLARVRCISGSSGKRKACFGHFGNENASLHSRCMSE